MNIFYKQLPILLWFESILLLIVGFYPALILIEAGAKSPYYYFLFLFYIPILQFSSTPIFRLIGIYKYYSPMLIGYLPNKIQIDLHSGSSFDYLFIMRKYKSGNETRNQLFIYYIEGLLHLIRKIESGEIPKSVSIIGTSYFFNERTIKKLGFDEKKPTLFYRLNLLINFIDIFWMYSLSKNRIGFPNLLAAKKLSISGEALIAKRTQIEYLYKTINTKLA